MSRKNKSRAYRQKRPSLSGVLRAAPLIFVASLVIQPAMALAAPSAGDSNPAVISSANATSPKMDAAAAANIFREFLKKRAAGEKIEPVLVKQFIDASNNDPKTGPKVGEKVPDFSLTDQNGKQWSLHELMGPKGLLLVFFRSADW